MCRVKVFGRVKSVGVVQEGALGMSDDTVCNDREKAAYIGDKERETGDLGRAEREIASERW